ncbi:MAG: tetratricopeptide repeat protein [Prevotella sp.]|nr:tetratricopeptide repeat protein [Prevotella sp.]
MKKTGDEYFDSEEFREMLDEYEKAVSAQEPVFMDAEELADIADYYQYTGHADKAEDAITLALSLSPGAIAPLTYRIHQALYEGDTRKAWQMYDQIIETDEPDYVYNRAEILIAEDKIEEADKYLREQFQQVPPDERQDFVMDVANIYADYGQPEKAMEWMNRALPEQSEDFKELMGRTLFGLGKYKDSERIFNELVDKEPFSTTYWNALASAQYMNEDYQNAIQSSEYAIAIDPKDPDGLLAKANGLYQLGNYEDALKYFERYLEQVPDDEWAMLYQGICLINMSQPQEAIDILMKAAHTAPDDSQVLSDIYQELAFAYSETGNAQEALRVLEKTSDMDCDHVQIEIVKGHVMLADDNLEKAEEYFQSAISISDDQCDTWLRIIVSFHDNNYVEAAYRLFKNYFALCRNIKGPEGCTKGYAFMALCCYDLKRDKEFLKYLQIACRVNPQECRSVLSHLFPEGLAPEKYYTFIKEKLNS